MRRKRAIALASLLAAFALFFLIVSITPWWESVLHYLFPSLAEVIYPRTSLSIMVFQHIGLVAVSSFLTIAIGLPLGIFVTRRLGRDFLPIVNNLVSVGQTFPPVAVLALAVPALGFGTLPTLIALFLYGLLPVVRNTIAGLDSVAPAVLDAARGLGMNKTRMLFKVEIPLAQNIIMAGIRISVVINIGTAMIGAVIGSGGLGAPIVAGLVQDNIAFILEGVLPAAGLAILVDQLFNNLKRIYPA
jgi:osmoprotectant transport system permease protein